MSRAALLPLLAALALAGCGTDADPGPGGVTAGEARGLDAAAAATDINASSNDTEQAQ